MVKKRVRRKVKEDLKKLMDGRRGGRGRKLEVGSKK